MQLNFDSSFCECFNLQNFAECTHGFSTRLTAKPTGSGISLISKPWLDLKLTLSATSLGIVVAENPVKTPFRVSAMVCSSVISAVTIHVPLGYCLVFPSIPLILAGAGNKYDSTGCPTFWCVCRDSWRFSITPYFRNVWARCFIFSSDNGSSPRL